MNKTIDWIGIIPDSWEIKKISAVYEERTTKVSDKDYEPLSVTKNGIVPQLDNAAKTDNGDNRKLVKKNDFVINSRSDRRGSCGISDYDGSCSVINIVLKPKSNMCNKYYSYVFQTELFADEFYKMGYGIVDDLWSTKWGTMKNIYIPVPSLKEQYTIANFLENKIKELDELLININHEIDILLELKQRKITDIVLNGISSNVKKKKINNEWIKELPVEWDATKIGLDAWLRARLGWKGLKAEEYVLEGYPLLSAFNIQNNKLSWDNLNFINEYRYNESPEIMLKKGDIILVKDGAGIGKCAYIDDLPHGGTTTNGSLAVITTKSSFESKYLYYYFISSVFQNYILRIINGMGVPHLSQEELRKLVIPKPPIKVQRDIIEKLDSLCNEVDNILEVKKKQLNKLEVYKKSIIYEYVTGKKRVKGAEELYG